MALAYIVYQIAGFLWGYHVGDFFVISTLFWPFQVAYFFIFGKGLVSLEEYWIFLPISFFLQVLVANGVHYVFNGHYLLARDLLYDLFYYVKVIFQLVVLHAVMFLWWLPEPWGGFTMCLLYTVLICLFYWFNKYDKAYCRKVHVCGDPASVLHCQWWVLFVPAIFFYTLISYLAPLFWPFWYEAGLALIQAIYLIVMLAVFAKDWWRHGDYAEACCSDPVHEKRVQCDVQPVVCVMQPQDLHCR